MPAAAGKVFNLPDKRSAKRQAELIAEDQEHFALIAATLEHREAEVQQRLEMLRRAQGGKGQAGVQRDAEIHQYARQLETLKRFGIDLCIGRIQRAGEATPLYIGRTGLTGVHGERLLIDWRAPAAEAFFAATSAEPMDVVSRRRYRWAHGQIVDYWDEVLNPELWDGHAALDDQSAFIASLAHSRTSKMQDVLATIQADQDAIIRTSSQGALVLDAGPGTGKTVVALHRAARLLYSDPRLNNGQAGGILFIGPTQSYREYVDDVLPSLGEDTVQICTLRDLVPEGDSAPEEPNQEVAHLKSSLKLVDAIANAPANYRRPPAEQTSVETPWGDLWLSRHEWAEAFRSFEPGTPHNEARAQAWEILLEILAEQIDEDTQVPLTRLRRYLADGDLWREFVQAWPLLRPEGVLADLYSTPDLLGRCAPELSEAEITLLQRNDPSAWTVSDLPLLDAARLLIGDPQQVQQLRRRQEIHEAEQEQMGHVVDNLIAADTDGESLETMLRQEDLQDKILDDGALPRLNPAGLAGPFGHIIVDEAQELTDAQWQMVLRRCPSQSLTIVGDRAQARHGFFETWTQRLHRVGLRSITEKSLHINYRTPEEIMEEAAPVIRRVLPQVQVPESIRSSGIPVTYGSAAEAPDLLHTWLQDNPHGTACIIGDSTIQHADYARVRSLSARHSKGLEFDLVILIEPEEPEASVEATVDKYVAMTRATSQLIVLTG